MRKHHLSGGGEGNNLDTEALTDPLEFCISKLQRRNPLPDNSKAKDIASRKWLTLLNDEILIQNDPPRWVLLVSPEQWLLIDRAKFAQRRLLRFDWTELLSRRDDTMLKATSLLLSRETLIGENSQSILEALDAKSARHAYGVSKDLKYALRESIELLGNEAVRQLAEKRVDAEQLSTECLRYMYRLLFIFFVESRPDLNYVPINKSETYLTGYSLEALRDLEMLPLVQEEDRNGRYIHDSIQKLFAFFFNGTPHLNYRQLGDTTASKESFDIHRLPSTLFDPKRMSLLSQVVFPNHVLQKVIELMSLSRSAKNGKGRQRRGRISYAHLGLNQLGAVYEGLLSYRGFFAEQDLYEVKKSDENYDELKSGFFVTSDELDRYHENEKVTVKDEVTGEEHLKKYSKGSFIYRMAGRERENSASYYTPESLTQCLVKESLDVLVKEQLDGLQDDKARAEKILTWRICEPAMGSAAFLNEAINQISDLYMQYAEKSDVEGAKLTQTQYREKRQRVKMYLADNNVYGVDLNPIAVELAEVSLWLNSLSSDHFVPWFGLQLYCGNSLIGCRRQAFYRSDLEKNRKTLVLPHDVGPEGLKQGEIWHFLVPDSAMSQYLDKDVKKLFDKDWGTLEARRKEFLKPFSSEELSEMERISRRVEMLWQTWAKRLYELDKKTSDLYEIYGHEISDEEKTRKECLSYVQKNELIELAQYGDGSFENGEFARLKLAMDYWCSLWFWPITMADQFPSREEFLLEMATIVEGTLFTTEELNNFLQSQQGQSELFATESNKTNVSYADNKVMMERNGKLKINAIHKNMPRTKIVSDLSEKMRFLHWPLRFAAFFIPQNGEHIGFDLTLGNPPWKVASWKSGDVLSDFDPIFIFRKDYSAKVLKDVLLGKRDVDDKGRSFFERNPKAKKAWITEYGSIAGQQNFFNSERLFPELKGSATDLFKLFLPTVWRMSSPQGVQGFVHPETVYTETHGHALRLATYHRIRKHYQFINRKNLFDDIDSQNEFSLNVYSKQSEKINFESINNLYEAQTIDQCRQPSNIPVEGKKDKNNQWNIKGHPDRLFNYTDETLRSIAQVFGTDTNAPLLPSIHAKELLEILQKFGQTQKRLGSLKEALTISSMWHESQAKEDGTMRELAGNATVFPESSEDAILNGPHVFVGSPLFKCPRNPCIANSHWDAIDLTVIPEDYLPRVKYLPAVDRAEYVKRMAKVAWKNGHYGHAKALNQVDTSVDSFYRVALREMVPLDGERTLTAGILPPKVAHIGKVVCLAFKDERYVSLISGYFASLPIDFFVRQQNKGDMHPSLLKGIPLPEFGRLERFIVNRALCLNVLTVFYKDLWERSWTSDMVTDQWSYEHPGLNSDFFASLKKNWQRDNALRTDLERRQALLEIDVLVSLAWNLTLEALITYYRLTFRVMKNYEEDTWYDQRGRIIFTSNSSLGIGLSRKANSKDEAHYAVNHCERESLGWNDVKDMTTGTVQKTFIDTTLKENPKRTIEYVAPFFKMNREEDYARAWAHFEKLK